jgi:hypothetical protein
MQHAIKCKETVVLENVAKMYSLISSFRAARVQTWYFLPSIRTLSASWRWSNLLTQPFKVPLSMRNKQLSKKLTNFDLTWRFITVKFGQNFSDLVSLVWNFTTKKRFRVVGGKERGNRTVLLLHFVSSSYFMWQVSFFNSRCYSTAHCEWQTE